MSYSLIVFGCLLAAQQGEIPQAQPPALDDRYAPVQAAPLSAAPDAGQDPIPSGPSQPVQSAPIEIENGQSLPPDAVRGETDAQVFPSGSPGGLPTLSADLQTPFRPAQETPQQLVPNGGASQPPAVEFSGAQPAGESLAPVRSPTETAHAEEMLVGLLVSETDDGLAGEPLTLLEALGGTSLRAQQARIISAYWRLSIQIGEYHAAQAAVDRLTRLTSSSGPSSADLALAIAEARIDIQTAHLAVVELQHELVQERGAVTSRALPLPADRPHVGSYRTYYEEIFPGQPAGVARRIHDTLPLRLEEIRARAAGMEAAQAKVDQVSGVGGYSQAAGDALAAEARLRRHEEQFLDGVLQYNMQIAQYVHLATPEGTGGARLVSMLIKADPERAASSTAVPVDRLNSVLIQRQPTLAQPTLAQPSGAAGAGVVQASGESPAGESANRVEQAGGVSPDSWRRADDALDDPLGTGPPGN